MPYAKTPLSATQAHVADPPPKTLDGRETPRNVVEDGYPAWLPEELRPAHGFMVGIAVGFGFWAIVILLAMVIS